MPLLLRAAVGRQDHFCLLGSRVPLGNLRPVQQLSERVVIPPDGEVGRAGGRTDRLPLGRSGGPRVRPSTRAPRVGLGSISAARPTPDVHAQRRWSRETCPVRGSYIAVPGRSVGGPGLDLVDAINLEAGSSRVQVGHVERIAVAQARSRPAL